MSRLRTLAPALAALAVSFLAVSPAAAEEPPPAKLPSRVVLLSDHSAPVKTWSPVTVRVRIEAADGTPLAGRQLRFWDDSYTRWQLGVPAWQTTDANGETSTVVHPDGNILNPVRMAAYWHGDATYEKAIVEWNQPVTGYTTTLSAVHETQRTSGQTLPVTLSVRRDDPASSANGCLDGAVVKLELTGPSATQTATAVIEETATACTASAEFPLSVTPGDYTLRISTGHEGWLRTDEPRTLTRTVHVAWQNVFADAYGRGTAYVNYASRDYRIVLADGRDSGVRHAGDGMTRTGVTGTVPVWRLDLSHTDGADSATGAFYSTGAFTAHGVLAGTTWALGR